MFFPPPRSPWLCAAAVAAALSVALPAAAQQVGVSSAVNPATTAAPPGGTEKTLLVGENIVFNEHIATGPEGQTQILFVDESAMSIGPNSDMTIDEFVYDPKTGTGTEALSATRGVFRYVGGKLSKGAAAVAIKTPVATIGIRGGVFLMDLLADGQLNVVFLYGKGLTVTGFNGVSEIITRPGFGLTVHGRGSSPSSPFAVPHGSLATYINQLDGRSGSSGGSSQPPSDSSVANSGITQTVSGNITNSVQQAVQNQVGAQLQTQTQTTTTAPSTVNTLNTTASQSQPIIVQSADTGGSPPNPNPPSPNPPSPNPPPPQQVGLTGAATGINTANHVSGFTGQLVPYSGGTLSNGVFMATIGGAQLTFNLAQGTGTIGGAGATPSNSGPITGSVTTNADGSFFYGNASLNSDPSKVAFIYGGQPVSQSVYGSSNAAKASAYQVQQDALLQSQVPFVSNQLGGAIPNPSVSPVYVAIPANTGFSNGAFQGTPPAVLQASLGINGTGVDQSSVLVVAVGNAVTTNGNPGQTTPLPALSGNAEGSYRAGGAGSSTRINTSLLTGIDGVGNSFYGNNSVEGFVLTPNACCNGSGSQVAQIASATNTQTGAVSNYGFVQPATAISTPAIGNGPQTSQTLLGLVGGTMVGTASGRSVPYALSGGIEITTIPSNQQISAVIGAVDPFTSTSSGLNAMGLVYGTVTPSTTATHQGYINDNLFGVLEAPPSANTPSEVNNVNASSSNLYLVNSNAVPNNPLLPANGLCQCQYLQWGYWGGEVDTGSGGSARTDIGHINTWVAGVQTPSADISNLTSMSAVGNFVGNAIGTVNNNGASYLASGQFQSTYNFGSLTGTLAINNFDGKSFHASVSGARGAPLYTGSLTGTNLSGTASGYFFGPKAAETGGNFAVQAISGLPYQASGVFAGKRN